MRISILCIKSPDKETYDPYYCGKCNNYDRMVLDIENNILTCPCCDTVELLSNVLKQGKPFGFKYAKLAWDEIDVNSFCTS